VLVKARRVLVWCCSFLGDRARLRTALAAQVSMPRNLFFAGGPSCCPLLPPVGRESMPGIRHKVVGGSRLVLAPPHPFLQSMRAEPTRSPGRISACRRTPRRRGEASVGRHRAHAGVRRTFANRPEIQTPRWGLGRVPLPSRNMNSAAGPFVPRGASRPPKGKPCLAPSFGCPPRLEGRLRHLGLGPSESAMLLRGGS